MCWAFSDVCFSNIGIKLVWLVPAKKKKKLLSSSPNFCITVKRDVIFKIIFTLRLYWTAHSAAGLKLREIRQGVRSSAELAWGYSFVVISFTLCFFFCLSDLQTQTEALPSIAPSSSESTNQIKRPDVFWNRLSVLPAAVLSWNVSPWSWAVW